MRKMVFLTVGVLIISVFAFLLSGCTPVSPIPSSFSNPYLPDKSSEYDLIRVSVSPVLLKNDSGNFSEHLVFSPLYRYEKLKDISFSLLAVTFDCLENARYETILHENTAESKMIFSNAWDADPNTEGEMGQFFDFEIKRNSEVYLGSDIRLIDGPSGNTVGTMTTQIGTVTVKRVTSYVSDLKVENHTYSNVLKVDLFFSANYDEFNGASVQFSYYFEKNIGLVKFDSYINMNSQKLPLMSVDLVKTDVGKYEIGPAPARALSPNNTQVSGDVVLTWNSTETNVTYDLILFDSNGDSTRISSLKSTTYDIGVLNEDVYLWTIVTVTSNGLSTISKPAFFVVY